MDTDLYHNRIIRPIAYRFFAILLSAFFNVWQGRIVFIYTLGVDNSCGHFNRSVDPYKLQVGKEIII